MSSEKTLDTRILYSLGYTPRELELVERAMKIKGAQLCGPDDSGRIGVKVYNDWMEIPEFDDFLRKGGIDISNGRFEKGLGSEISYIEKGVRLSASGIPF